jgi:hypothetical protein
MIRIAALFVAKNGPYFGLPHVDPWPLERDARKYRGPYPIVAHPPCERWGRYWPGGPSAKKRRKLGDDGGCFATALMHVRRWGGVLEHPAHSHAFRIFGLGFPPPEGGWIPERFCQGGWICHVEQGHYGHPARKATWLYAVMPPGESPPELKWGPCCGRRRLEDGFHTNNERARARAAGVKPVERLSDRQRLWTPPRFRDVLLKIACLAA